MSAASQGRTDPGEMSMIAAALWYAEHGFPVFPVHRVRHGVCSCNQPDCGHPGKHPRSAHGFKDATKDPAQIKRWWKRWPDANIGVPTGPASGILVIDIDPRNGGDTSWDSLILKHGSYPATAEQITGGGGRHIVFRDPAVVVPKELAPGIDMKGRGGYIIVAPSIHPSGQQYIWDGIDGQRALLDVAPVPAWLVGEFAAVQNRKRPASAPSGKKWASGERNTRLTSLAGTMRRPGMTREAIVAALLEENRSRCEPRLLDDEVRRIADSVARYAPETAAPDPAEPPEEYDLNQAQILIAIADEAELFHTPEGEAYAQIPVDDHDETWLLRKKGFRAWLLRTFYQKCAKPPSSQALQSALGLLEAKALFEGPEAPLFVRVAEHDGRIYIDLCDAKWRVIEISPQGWRIMADPPVRFRRAKGMKPLPQPVTGGSIAQLRSLLNIGGDHNWILCVCWLVATCRAAGPFPILIFQGEQGSAKSTMVKLLRRLIDPSSALVRTPPRDGRDLLIAASNSWVIAYDNLSGIPHWLSDSLCRLATGGGFSTRELYTDSDEVFFDAIRPVVLNGIDHLAERADLADRALILHLPPIPNENRRDEAQLYADFDRQLPQILGALFSAASAALARLPRTKLDSKPRMADFALWASAAEQALGFPQGAFMKAFAGNRAEAVHETLESDPVGAAILSLMDKRLGESVEGSCKELLVHLEQQVDDGVKKSRDWPKSPRALSSRLRRLVTFLREMQIQATFNPRGAKGQRIVTICGIEPHSTVTIVTTGIPDPAGPSDQADTVEQPGGGRIPEVTIQVGRDGQLSPGSASSKSLSENSSIQEEAEVTEVTVDCGAALPVPERGSRASARSESPSPVRERIEL
jgi:hypothetical protein